MEDEVYDVTVGSGFIGIFRHYNYKLERVFAEFVDNSLQSFLDHEELKNMPDGGKCRVTIDWDDEKITILDNAYGMDKKEFGRALKLKAFNPDAHKGSRLSVYGMGLKYAAVYLGEHYAIESSRYGEAFLRRAEIDVPEFERNNPETLNCKLTDEFEETHYSKITITHIRQKKTPSRLAELRERLGTIYNRYIVAGQIEIIVNKIPVNYKRPEVRLSDEGEKYLRNFKDSFIVDGKKYEYSGFIAILPKGCQDITGLNLVQAKRCVELGYKPKELFGQGNSFQSSRVFGEVVFEGANYDLSYTKDKFVWADDGVEDAFIESLKNNEGVKYIISQSKKLKKAEDQGKITTKTIKNINSKYGGIKVIEDHTNTGKKESGATPKKVTENKTTQPKVFEKTPNTGSITTQTIAPQNNIPATKSDEPIEQDVQSTEQNYARTTVPVGDKDVIVYINVYGGDPKEGWVSLKQYGDGYLLSINNKNQFVADYFTTESAKTASNNLAIALITSLLQAQESGLKFADSITLIKTLNKVMGAE